MVDHDVLRSEDRSEWRVQALMSAAVVGLWEWDHCRDTARYCSTAAKLLAGNVSRAWHELDPTEAFAGILTEDTVRLQEQMQNPSSRPDMRIREYRIRTRQDGTRQVLCRGRTSHDEDGNPIRTMGVVIDVTEIEIHKRGSSVEDRLQSAAEHGLAAYEAVEASGMASLIQPARALLFAIGREIARNVTKGYNKGH